MTLIKISCKANISVLRSIKKIVWFTLFVIFFSCTQNKRGGDDIALYQEKGDSVIAQTFDTLRNTLLKAVSEKGFAGAVDFCNTNASSLTNTYATENVFVKRTSDKLRNAGNAPDSMERRILAVYLAMKNNKQQPQPIFEKDGAGNYHYFKPIIMQAMCLNCHGDKSVQIQPETWQAIQAKYPADAAFGYKEGDVRGIWHVGFMTSKE